MSKFGLLALLCLAPAAGVRAQVLDPAGNATAPYIQQSPQRPVAGDPVDLASGLYERTTLDLTVEDTVPIQFARTYRNDDHRSRAFGIGTNHGYDMFIVGDAEKFTYVELVMANGGWLHYDRISPGTGYADGVFEHTSSPTEYYRSRISWNGSGWTVALTDGSSFKLLGCSPKSTRPGQCGVIEMRGSGGEVVHIERQPNGNVTRIVSPHGKWVALSYDSEERVSKATASTGAVVNYDYDGGGRLIRVTPAGQTQPAQSYQYDDDDRMIGVVDGDSRLVNEFDGEAVVHQVWKDETDTQEWRMNYVFDAQNHHLRTEVIEPGGTLRRVTFNDSGYALTDAHNVGRPDESTMVFDTDPSTNHINNLSVSCASLDHHIEVKTSLGPMADGEDVPDDDWMVDLCRQAVAAAAAAPKTP